MTIVWQTHLNEKDDEILMNYGKILQNQGRIKSYTRYSINNYILKNWIETVIRSLEGVEINGQHDKNIPVKKTSGE